MSWMLYLLPLFLGSMAVLQTGINRQAATTWGLAYAAFFSNLMTIALCLGLYLVALRSPQLLPELFRARPESVSLRWWHFLPGVCGFLLVSLAPYGMANLGATRFFIGFIASQIIFSVVWDQFALGISLNPWRLFGILLTFAGALLVVTKK